MPVLTKSFEEGFRFHAFDAIFSCRINIGKDEDIGVIKGSEKIFEQGLRPRVAVRLKYRDDPLRPTGSRRLERGHNLYWMMAVIIHDENPLLFSFDLKPSLNPAEIAQRLLNDLERNI